MTGEITAREVLDFGVYNVSPLIRRYHPLLKDDRGPDIQGKLINRTQNEGHEKVQVV